MIEWAGGKGLRPFPSLNRIMRSYIAFIRGLHEELIEGLREAENLGFHHAEAGTDVYVHYQRLVTWIDEVEERLIKHGNSPKRVKERLRAAAQVTSIDRVGGHDRQLGFEQRESGEHRLDGDVGRGRSLGIHPDEDAP